MTVPEPTSYEDVKYKYESFRNMYSMLMSQFYQSILSFNEYKGVVHFSPEISYAHMQDILICRKMSSTRTGRFCNYSFYIDSSSLVRCFDASRVSRYAQKLHAHRDFSLISHTSAGSSPIHIGSIGFKCDNDQTHLELLNIMFNNRFVQQNGYMPSTAVRFPNKYITAYDPAKVIEPSIDGGTIPFSGEEVMQYLSDDKSDSYFNMTLSTSLSDQLKMAMLTMPGWTSEVLDYTKENNIAFSCLLELVAMMNEQACNAYIFKMRDLNKEMRLFNAKQNGYANTTTF